MKLNNAKISIPEEAPLLSRQRLLDALWKNLASGCATIINGRAGTGKTMLATDFAQRCGRSVAWYKVDTPEINLAVFVEYLVASVGRTREGFGVKTLLELLESTVEFNLSKLEKLAEAFVYDLEMEVTPLLMAIDDLHLIYDADWLSPFFHRLLNLLPAEVHVLILGRGLPPAPLWRLRSKQHLFVINEPMLAFSELEAKELFAQYALSEGQAQHEWQLTRGRAANLHASAIRAWSDASSNTKKN
ncbi:MAG: hypothetical protein JNK38_01685 [Acidobacteria bacterium]|nr:hypothetical protein [Acidobacteriota bacterium]